MSEVLPFSVAMLALGVAAFAMAWSVQARRSARRAELVADEARAAIQKAQDPRARPTTFGGR